MSDSTGAFSSSGGTDNLFSFGTAGATSGIGILRRTGSAVLKLELDALESQGLGKTVSNPKLFTLDNQTASIKQGEQIPVSGGDGADTFADAALKLTVTPNIIGDGKVKLESCEKKNIKNSRRSIIANKEILKGGRIKKIDLSWVRPQKGLKPGDENKIIGKIAAKLIKKGELIKIKNVKKS